MIAFPFAAQAARGPDHIADVAEAVIDAVVNISTSQTVAAGGPSAPAGTGSGSGSRRTSAEPPARLAVRGVLRRVLQEPPWSGRAEGRRAAPRQFARIRFHHRCRGTGGHQQPRHRGRGRNHGRPQQWREAQGRVDRQGFQDRSRTAAREAREAAQGGEVRQLRQAAARRMGDRNRQSVQPRRLGDGRHRVGAQSRYPVRTLRQLHPDRRRH